METLLKSTKALDIIHRPRRNRRSPAIRGLAQETRLHPSNFVTPLFILEGNNTVEPIKSMPGINRLTIDLILKEIEELLKLGIQAVDLFPVISQKVKDAQGSEATREDNLLFSSIRAIKTRFPELCVMVDVALDPYTTHGHDGIVNDYGEIDNDATLPLLAEMSVQAAYAGADIIAPSDMMDGRVGYIRNSLDEHGHTQTGILAYAAKYASAFYGPFRDALHSSPKFGDKKTYQMNPANSREAILEANLDEIEGADMLLIKPALPYLDVIAKIRDNTNLPIGAYHVSGEYSMILAAEQNNWLDADKALLESLISVKRAGADFIFSYAAKRIAPLL